MPEEPETGPRLFRVRVVVTLVNGDCTKPIPIEVLAVDEEDAARSVTPAYIMRNVSDDWGMPIRNVRVVGVRLAQPPRRSVARKR